MGYILPEFITQLSAAYGVDVPKVFIETGTFKGGVPHRIMENRVHAKVTPILDPIFDAYYTIELSRDICAVASKRYQLFESLGLDITADLVHTNQLDENWGGNGYYFEGQLQLIEGDSASKLEHLLSGLDVPAFFWLDAHSGATKYAHGVEDVPLFRELEVIARHGVEGHIIAIDDAHLFGRKQFDKKTGAISADYTGVTWARVAEYIYKINPKYEIYRYAPYGMEMCVAILPN